MRSLVISIFLYACESWTLTAELEKIMQAFEVRCYRRLLNISYKDHVTNEEVRRKIQAAIGKYEELLTLVKKRKLRWFGHVSRSSDLAKTILQGTVSERKKKKRQTDYYFLLMICLYTPTMFLLIFMLMTRLCMMFRIPWNRLRITFSPH